MQKPLLKKNDLLLITGTIRIKLLIRLLPSLLAPQKVKAFFLLYGFDWVEHLFYGSNFTAQKLTDLFNAVTGEVDGFTGLFDAITDEVDRHIDPFNKVTGEVDGYTDLFDAAPMK